MPESVPPAAPARDAKPVMISVDDDPGVSRAVQRGALEVAPDAKRVLLTAYAGTQAANQGAEAVVREREEKLAAPGTLSAGLAHELNNPAAAARRSASEPARQFVVLNDTLRAFVWSGVEREDAGGPVTELHDSTARMSEIVAAAKDYTYMDRAQTQTIDVHDGIESTLTMLHHKLKRGDVRIVRDFDRTLPRITAHASQLNQVWTNLLDNAIDAVDGDGTITIRTRPVPDGVTIEMGDDGPGVPPELQSRLFEPFFTTKEVGKGTGLGLDIVRRIVENHHGQVRLVSSPHDTRFEVRLPLD